MSSRRIVKEAFLKWDKDRNGTISIEELADVLIELCSVEKCQAEVLLKQADKDGNGVIDYSEFVDWIMGSSAPLGAAALLEDSDINYRADVAQPLGDPFPDVNGVLAWGFGPGSKGPVAMKPFLLYDSHTLACWVKFEALGNAEDQWVPLVGDKLSNWGFMIGLTPSGGFGLYDPRTSCRKATAVVGIPLRQWVLLVVRGKCSTLASSPQGRTEFLVCWDMTGFKSVGSMDVVGGGLVVAEFGSHLQGISRMATVSVWERELQDLELRNLFLHDAVRLGCVTDVQAAWMRLNRRNIPARSEEQDEAITQRCEAAEAGDEEVQGTLDLRSLVVVDADLPRILSAVLLTGPGGITTLRLADNYLTEDGMVAHLVPFMEAREFPMFIDITDNPDIGEVAEAPLLHALRIETGCRVEAKGTKVSAFGIAKLENITERAAAAVRQAANEKACNDFNAAQESIAANWKDQIDPPMAAEDDGDPALALVTGVSEDGSLQKPKKPLFKKFPAKSKESLKQVRSALAIAGRRFCDRQSGQAFAWSGGGVMDRPPKNCGGGQLLAHFSYLSYTLSLRGPEDFGLRLRAKGEAYGPGGGAGALGLHGAIEQGVVEVEGAVGKSYGKKALSLKLKNLTGKPQEVVVPAGTIFCHVSWNHHQNLLVRRFCLFRLDSGASKQQKIDAHCMNVSCGCPDRDPMALTPFLCERQDLLLAQDAVWDHFEGLFNKYKEEAGFGKKKKGKKQEEE